MIKLYLRDYRHELTTRRNVAEISVSLLEEALPRGAVRTLEVTDATHWIIHFEQKTELPELEGETDLNDFPDLQFILCLTREGQPKPGFNELHHLHIVRRDGEKRRYILYARNVHALKSKETREAFYAMGETEAEAVVKGEWRKVTQPLRRLFRRTQIIYMSSLAILLQGYLAAHAVCEGAIDWNDADIRRALIEMGWCESNGELAQIPNREVIGDSKEVVRRKEWFLGPFMSHEAGGAASKLRVPLNLRSKILEEWGGDDDCTLPVGLEKLLKTLEDENLKAVDSPKIVASAYLDISRRLKRGLANPAPSVNQSAVTSLSS